MIPFYTEILSPRRQSSNVLLYYIADIWDQLRSSSIPIVFAAFTRVLQCLECICEDNNPMARLSSCYLRTRRLDTLLTSGRNVLKVDLPAAPKCIFLKSLGVTLEPTLDIYLEQLRRRKTDKIRPTNVDWFYKDLVLFCKGDRSKFSLVR